MTGALIYEVAVFALALLLVPLLPKVRAIGSADVTSRTTNPDNPIR